MRFALSFAIWSLLGLFEASQLYVQYAYRGKPIGWGQAVAFGMALWYAWAVLAVFVFGLARRYPIGARNWPQRLTFHLAAGAGFALVKLVMDYPIIELCYCPQPGLMPFTDFYQMAFAGHFYPYVVMYWAILGVGHALNYYRQLRERESRTVQLEARLAQAQLQLLKMQLHPHFLLNTLNAISALIHKDIEVADHMLARLGDLLRLALDHSAAEEVSLRRELAFIQAYLEIEQARFGSRLNLQVQVEPDLLEALVPSLLLQPLVENSIRHGIALRTKPGQIAIRARRSDRRLRLEVCDDGADVRPGSCIREGIGLANTRARLQQLYGDEHRFELGRSAAGGFAVRIDIPLREAEETPYPAQRTLVM
jgi:anti-sigma regulatory factor (Ser/Thr protein kinase)